jgi:MFS family permease
MSGVLGNIMAGFTGPFIALIARDQLHTSATVLGLMMSAPFVGNLFAMFWANAMEGKSKLPFVVYSTMAARGVFLLMPFAIASTPFAVLIIVSSLLSTIAGPAYAAVMMEIYPKRIRGRAMGYVRVCTTSVAVLSVAVAGPLLVHVSYRIVFPLAALVGMASSWVFKFVKTSEVDTAEKPKLREFLLNTVMILKHDKPFRWFAMSIFTVGFGTLTVMPLYTIFQVDTLHIKTTELSYVSNVAIIMAIVSFFFWGRYVDKKSPLKGSAISVLLVTMTPLTYAFLAHFEFARHWTILLPAAAIQGVANAGIELSYFNSILKFSGPDRVSHYQALFSSLLGIRGAIAPLIGTFLVQHNLVTMESLFLMAAVLCLISVAMQVYGTRSHST